MVKKNSYVEIHKVIFEAHERTAKIPEETKKVPYEMFIKGFLLLDASIGDLVTVETITGRVVEGTLLKENPTYDLGYGGFVPHILKIKQILRGEMDG